MRQSPEGVRLFGGSNVAPFRRPTLDRVVGETVRRIRGSHCQGRLGARVAVDATRLAQGAVSTFLCGRASSWAKVAALKAEMEVKRLVQRSDGLGCFEEGFQFGGRGIARETGTEA